MSGESEPSPSLDGTLSELRNIGIVDERSGQQLIRVSRFCLSADVFFHTPNLRDVTWQHMASFLRRARRSWTAIRGLAGGAATTRVLRAELAKLPSFPSKDEVKKILFRDSQSTQLFRLLTVSQIARTLDEEKRADAVCNVFQVLQDYGAKLDAPHFTMAISACGRSSLWMDALALLKSMPEVKLDPNIFSYSASTSACERASEWQRALHAMHPHLGEMSLVAHLQPNLLSFSSAISACEKAGAWQKAIDLLHSASEARISPDVIIYSAPWFTTASTALVVDRPK
eukprot:Skav220076  [mRNA]  locus=scaffold262:170477:180681:+ [translate_table: standard]